MWYQAPKDGLDVNVATIVSRSVDANNKDFNAAPEYNYKECDKNGRQNRTLQVTMMDGSPYSRLIELNGKPLSAQQTNREQNKFRDAIQQRKSESASERKTRIEKFQKGRQRNHVMMSQLSSAFNFTLEGTYKLRGFTVWQLKAVPRPGYRPPNMDSEVLPGMEGEMWIDQSSYEWVKVTARVIHPVSIEGFLAQVQPGTRFEVEKSPVQDGRWKVTHYSSYADAHVLYLFNHQQSDDVTYFDFQPIKP